MDGDTVAEIHKSPRTAFEADILHKLGSSIDIPFAGNVTLDSKAQFRLAEYIFYRSCEGSLPLGLILRLGDDRGHESFRGSTREVYTFQLSLTALGESVFRGETRGDEGKIWFKDMEGRPCGVDPADFACAAASYFSEEYPAHESRPGDDFLVDDPKVDFFNDNNVRAWIVQVSRTSVYNSPTDEKTPSKRIPIERVTIPPPRRPAGQSIRPRASTGAGSAL